jgi:hypothetical protein
VRPLTFLLLAASAAAPVAVLERPRDPEPPRPPPTDEELAAMHAALLADQRERERAARADAETGRVSWLANKLQTDPAFAREYRLHGERHAAAEAKRERRRLRNLRRGTVDGLDLAFLVVLLVVACGGGLFVGTLDGRGSACRADCIARDHDSGRYRTDRCVCSDEVTP